jgi:glucose/arabinose dehydrogenase
MRQVVKLLRLYKQPLRASLAIAIVAACVVAYTRAPEAQLGLLSGFVSEKIATVPGARELAALPNGDLLVAHGREITIIPAADGPGPAGAAATFVRLPDGLSAGVALGPDGAIYAATGHAVWRIAYQNGAQAGSAPQLVARVRAGPVAPRSDGDVHHTTSVAVNATTIFIGIGSSCNACTEFDPTRASIQEVPIGGGAMTARATRVRNPIGPAIDPATGHLWAAGAGQDALPYGHPYEFADDVSAHEGVADYGWPACEEDHKLYNPLHVEPQPTCEGVVVPLVEFPAYATHIGLVFYPRAQTGAHVFPERYRGGLFVASHGSWHCCPSTPPRVAFVPMHGDLPAKAVDWNDPSTQWEPFAIDALAGANSTRWSVRFTGIAVGTQGSLFVADDLHGAIYRIRPQ